MTIGWREQLRPGLALREIVTQATASLIAMDAERLEELALCCADLNRGSDPGLSEQRNLDLADQIPADQTPDQVPADVLQAAVMDLRLLDRVLFESRANLAVLTRLHDLRLREIHALQQTLKDSSECVSSIAEVDYGDN